MQTDPRAGQPADPSMWVDIPRLIGLRSRFDVSWACDTDHDRHGVVTRSAGLLNPNHYLAVAISYLFQRRKGWPAAAVIGGDWKSGPPSESRT